MTVRSPALRGAAILAACFALCLASATAQQRNAPSNFAFDALVTSGLQNPVSLSMLPDGRILIGEQVTGHIKVFANGTVATIGTVPDVRTDSSLRGLLSIAVDSRWPSRPYVYALHNSQSGADERIVMFPVTGSLSSPNSTNLTLGSSYVVLDGITDLASGHNGGTLRFGPDDMLYASIGEDFNPCAAQSTTNLLGCILRLDVSSLPRSGSGPPPKSAITPGDNPFPGNDANSKLYWAMGLRNPFRFNIDPVSSHIYIGDVGEVGQEEFNEVVGGENLGWPYREGTLTYTTCNATPPTLVDPIATYGREWTSQAINGWGRYRNKVGGPYNFGQSYEGDTFYGDIYGGWVRRLKWDGTQWKTPPAEPGQPTPTDWGAGFFGVADVAFGPDGAIYFVTMVPGTLIRMRNVPKYPVINAPSTAAVGKPVTIECVRDPGDPTLLVMGPVKIQPLYYAGLFGAVEIIGFPLAWGDMDATGKFTHTFANVPPIALGATFYFQNIVKVNNDLWISTPHSIQITQ